MSTPVLDRAALARLAATEVGSPVLSIHLRTDPRDPANTRAAPAWRAELTAGLGALAEDGLEREERLALRAVREEVAAELEALDAPERARSLSWFLSLDGTLDERYATQLPLRSSAVVLDARPFVSPAVDLVERGAPAGIVIAARDRVRVLEWANGAIDEERDLELELDTSDWRRYRGAGGAPRDNRGTTHTESFGAREEEHRDRFLADAAAQVARRIEEARWERVVLVAPGGLAPRLNLQLPDTARARVRLDLDLNLIGLPAVDVATRLEPHLDALHHDDALARADELRAAGPAAASGPAAVLAALAKGQVAQLVLDPLHVPDTSGLPEVARTITNDGTPPGLAGERAVEAALAADASVVAASVAESTALAEADGMLARLRW